MYNRGLFILVCLLPCISTWAQSKKTIWWRDGLLDVSQWNFTEKKLPLCGQWSFYDHQLYTPADRILKGKITHKIPQSWNEMDPSRGGTGFGTYRLTLGLPPASSVPELAIELPQLYSSYILWANDKKIATCGTVGTTAEETIPQWLSQVVTFKNPDDTLVLTLQIANFHHNTGGIREIIYLGTPAMLNSNRTLFITANIIEVSFLILEGLIFLLIFLVWRRKKVVLYFSLLCLSWALRSAFSNLYLVTEFYPSFDWSLMLRIEYIALFLTTLFSATFLHQLFTNISNQVIKYLLIAATLFFVMLTVFSTPLVFTRWLPVYLTVSMLTIVYGAVIVIRAIVLEQKGVTFMVISIILGLIIFGYDIFSFKEGFQYNYLIMNAGYILIFLSTSFSLLLHLNIIKSKQASVLTYEDLYKNGYNSI